MSEEGTRVFWRHRFDRQSWSFRFLCSVCRADETELAGAGPRLTEVSENLLREYLQEIEIEAITCSGCGEVLISRGGS